MERRLVAILMADVVGYSRLMELDEESTLSLLMTHQRECVEPNITCFGGRIVKATGDGLLVEFGSLTNALRAAIRVQTEMAERNANTPEERRIVYRIGVNFGDVIVEGEDIFGAGVNIAAR